MIADQFAVNIQERAQFYTILFYTFCKIIVQFIGLCAEMNFIQRLNF